MTSKFKNNLTVSDDQIWRTSIGTELKSQTQWDKDWGFLVSEGFINRKSNIENE